MTGRASSSLRWTFVTSTLARPTGGDLALFELVNALSRIGASEVRLVHAPFVGSRVARLVDIDWFDFDPAVDHRFTTSLDPAVAEGASVVVYTTKLLHAALSTEGPPGGAALVDALRSPEGAWLPVLLLQGLGVFPPEVEALARSLPGPKVCVGRWLADRLVGEGTAASDVVHIPNGVDPSTFRILEPISLRPPRVATNFDPHPVKGGMNGIVALEQLRSAAGIEGIAFGTRAPDRALASGVRFAHSPDRTHLVREIYNRSRIYLQPSQREGFGMCAVEAMSCGCALVTTSNGGSSDYAHDGETALLCGSEPSEMAAAVQRLIDDDALRIRLAQSGARFVERFRWSASAAQLRDLARTRLDQQ